MTRPARPAPVLRFLRRPLWWAGAVLVLVATSVASAVPAVRADAASFDGARRLEAAATGIDPDTGLIDVTFPDPDTGEPVHATVLHRSYAEPQDGHIAVEVSRADPHVVRLADEQRGYLDDVGFYLAGLLLPLAVWVVRRWQVGRVERLMQSPETTFAMLGALTAPDWLHRRWRLSLYPVTARPGAEAVCTVELVSLPVPVAGAFPVDVKGAPRPFGTVAVRAGDDLFWPHGRGSATRNHPHLTALVGAIPPPTGTGAAPGRRPGLWGSRLLRLLGLAGVAGFLALGTTSTWLLEQRLERSRTAEATALADAPGLNAMVVGYAIGDRQQRAVVEFGGARPGAGGAVPIRYDPEDPSSAWPATGSQVVFTSVDTATFACLFGGIGAFVAAAVRRRQELDALGRYELATTGRLSLGHAGG